MARKSYNDGGMAFPNAIADDDAFTNGMTLRQWYAGHAPPLTGQYLRDCRSSGDNYLTVRAAWGFAYADAMIAHEKAERDG